MYSPFWLLNFQCCKEWWGEGIGLDVYVVSRFVVLLMNWCLALGVFCGDCDAGVQALLVLIQYDVVQASK